MKYPMTEKTDRPLFNYMVMENGEYDYYLYNSLDIVLKKAVELSCSTNIGLIYEVAFNNETKEYRGQNTVKLMILSYKILNPNESKIY